MTYQNKNKNRTFVVRDTRNQQQKFFNIFFSALFITSLFLCMMVVFSKASFPMRTGIGSVMDQEETERQLAHRYHMDLMKEFNDVAPERVQSVKLICAFTHSTQVPTWLRDSLPEEVSSKLFDFDMKGVQFKWTTPFENLVPVMNALSMVNGLGEDLGVMENDPRMRLIRMVNEVGFNSNADPIAHSKTLVRLAMNLNREDDYGLDRKTRDHMMAALFSQAGDHVLSFLSVTPSITDDMKQEALLSVAQLKRWAGYRARGTSVELAHLVESFSILKDMEKNEVMERELLQVQERSIPLMVQILSDAFLEWLKNQVRIQ